MRACSKGRLRMWLIVRSGDAQGKTENVTGDLLIGSDETCDLVIPDEKVSRRHAYLKIHDEGGFTLQDLGSANGTWVDGMRISGVVTLKGTEELKFGDTLVGLTQQDPAPTGTLPPTTPGMAVSKDTIPGVPDTGEVAAAASVSASAPPPPQGGHGGPPLVPKASRGPLLLVALILVLPLVAGGVVVLTKGSGKKGAVSPPTSPSVVTTASSVPTTPTIPTTPTTTPATTPTTLPPAEFPNTEEAILLQHIPKSFRGTCDRLGGGSVPQDALAAVKCFPVTGADEAHYIQFADQDAMLSYYVDRVFKSPAGFGQNTRANCDKYYNDEGKYPPTGETLGRVLCYVTPGSNRPYFEWTDNSCIVYSWAVRKQDQDAVALTNWWDDVKKSGPIGC
jgi:pSer/pThr/pTyr-binding forkhead associated (FHA) protein